MDIEELEEELYEDLNGRITAVDFTNDLVIRFQCDCWREANTVRKFQITCHGVKESSAQPSSVGGISFIEEHPLLWNHNEPHGYLYYSSAPKNRHEILGRLWESHQKIFGGWRPLSDYVHTNHAGNFIDFCQGGYGQLAHGPKCLLEEYQNVVSGLIKANYVASYRPTGNAKLLVFDDCFVVCDSVTLTEPVS
ncbi:hypothetical protein ACSV5M_10215 [Cellvibrio sp. ARAG 10.3]|uniref:hypothetical protein n=1 Tax=Cellvibrio sp. ARAG 10.3 TaxID=3451358 RepID=UPI003F4486B0